MKLSDYFLPAPLLLSILPTAQALVGSSWSISNVPSTGLTDITFPITIVEADHISGYYFAQQFNFVGLSDVGYTGIQPRPNKGGTSGKKKWPGSGLPKYWPYQWTVGLALHLVVLVGPSSRSRTFDRSQYLPDVATCDLGA